MGIAAQGAAVGSVSGGTFGFWLARSSALDEVAIAHPEKVKAMKTIALVCGPLAGALGGATAVTMTCGDRKFIHRGGYDD